MNPILSKTPYTDEDGVYRFTLSGINVSLANALRRIILSEIPTVVFHTETYKDNKCKITKNTGRLHNEIIKQRLSCIPIHSEDPDLVEKYVLELKVKNETDSLIIVTTEDFKIKNKETGNYLKEEAVRKIFPPNPITGAYIDFIRLRPKVGDSIDGEDIELTCEFMVKTAKDNAMYNVASKCAYGFTLDEEKAAKALEELKKQWESEGLTSEEISFNSKNFDLLDKQRYYLENSYDYAIQTVGVYTNEKLVKKGAIILHNKFADFVKMVDEGIVPIVKSETAMENSYDVVLENEDYTVGKVLEYILYEKYYLEEETLSFCGFKKLHPHNTSSIIRLAYNDKADKAMVQQYLRAAGIMAGEVFKKIAEMF